MSVSGGLGPNLTRVRAEFTGDRHRKGLNEQGERTTHEGQVHADNIQRTFRVDIYD